MGASECPPKYDPKNDIACSSNGRETGTPPYVSQPRGSDRTVSNCEIVGRNHDDAMTSVGTETTGAYRSQPPIVPCETGVLGVEIATKCSLSDG